MKIIILMYELINLKKKTNSQYYHKRTFCKKSRVDMFLCGIFIWFAAAFHGVLSQDVFLYVISISAKDQYSLSGWDNLLLLVTACWINCWHLSHTAPDLLSVSWWDCCWCRKALQGSSLTGIYQLAGICWNSRQS